MRWLIALVLVLLPLSASAQTSGVLDTEIDTSGFGEGWTLELRESTGTSDNPWRKRHAFFGPDGKRALILAFDIGESISDRAAGWELMKANLSRYVGNHALLAEIDEAFGRVDRSTVPPGVGDSIRSEFVDSYGQPLGFGIYASTTTKVAILVIVEGTVNDLTGVAATDYVAGLYFVALSAE